MKTYGIDKKSIELLKKNFENIFGTESKVKIYLFGSRSNGKYRQYSDIDLAIKSKDKNIDSKILLLRNNLEESNLPYKVDLVKWEDIISDYLPTIKKQKIPFWSPDEIERTSPWRICPIGQHWVRRHDRNLDTGTVVDRDGHCRKNPGRKDLLNGDEIDLISHLDIFKNPSIKASDNILKKYPNHNKYNELISGWTAYWNDVFKDSNPLHPNYVKILIASESGFDSNSKAENKLNVGQAQGLVQLTEKTQRILRDQKGELKNHYVILNKEEIWEPNKNICAAVRWLFRKKDILKKRMKREPKWSEVLIEYKGITNDKSDEALKIKRNLNELLKDINE
ncbi:MAG: nucleotidyltransferase domain-containing protein [Bacteriovoracaceae bacterium]|nr:nucleotidyltransferase domain-containing protein [Bacteriovoracaceae bacterium]